MFNSEIKKHVAKLIEDGVISTEDHDKALESLQDYWKDKLGLTWTVEDVLTEADGRGIDITVEQAIDVLASIQDGLDASVGVNNVLIADYVQELYG